MKRPTKRRSPCPVSCSLDLIGDRWTLLVVRDLMCGKSQFVEFCRSPEGIATNILTDRLQRLVEHGLVEKAASDEESRRDRYRLTTKGNSLRPVLDAIARWGLANIEGTEAGLKLKDA
ncbi:winged helix-turn-helix transcriptional regulator [Tautonia rosea]|uniref:winged helix-turn-helix transcriptional regulator n=1 Tax=Tautonia rosea TaxID=2728037 RepID=UPI0014754D97|nr:helix-turn-helix domain-containing protein [Tautonia rosea]